MDAYLSLCYSGNKLTSLPHTTSLSPKDFALQEQYNQFWKVTNIFLEWSSGVKTHRDHFVVGFSKEEINQRLNVFSGNLPDKLVKASLRLKDTRDWKVKEAREKTKYEKLGDKIYPYAYRPFDRRLICYELRLISKGSDKWRLMRHCIKKPNIGVMLKRKLERVYFSHAFLRSDATDTNCLGSQTYFFPLYFYLDEPQGQLFNGQAPRKDRVSNFTVKFLQAVRESLGTEPSPEEIFYYIYSVLYAPTYRTRYVEFLKIDFPRIPLTGEYKPFTELSNLGKELVDLHLMKHQALGKTDVEFPQSGSNEVEIIRYDEDTKRAYFNKEQCFDDIPKEVWEYTIGAYQVMEKYLKDRKGRKLSLDECGHYMNIAKAIRLTIELQARIDQVYEKLETQITMVN